MGLKHFKHIIAGNKIEKKKLKDIDVKHYSSTNSAHRVHSLMKNSLLLKTPF